MMKHILLLLHMLSLLSGYPLVSQTGNKLLGQSRAVDSTASPQANVVNIYPTTSQIPVNLLRFYIEFSQPMREGKSLAFIHLMDENGTDITGVFFDNQYELWNQDYTKLTLLIDPGRVKTGLQSHEKMGRAFEVGKEYTLSIDQNWLTLEGQPLKRVFSKTFVGVPAIVRGVDYMKWKISPPIAQAKAPLKIFFGQALDHVSTKRYIAIVDSTHNLIGGEILLKNEESEAWFYPSSEWSKGQYQIMVNSRLEDIVGNNINGAFDHEEGTLKDLREGLPVVIPFSINQDP